MKKCDVLIVGAGPAGGQCGRELAQQGFKVILVDKAKSFWENNYSSGGAPLELMSEFQLPDSIVGAYWDTLRIQSTHAAACWKSPSLFGPILDFDRLRDFLTGETAKNGGELLLGCLYKSHRIISSGFEVLLKDLSSSIPFSIEASILVDATGSDRRVLAGDSYKKEQAIAVTGMEHHVEVDQEIYAQYARSLNFFLGHHWMPQGYGWIFPMSPNKLKVGVIRYFQNKTYVPYDPSYKTYLNRLLGLCGSYKLHDQHGKTIYYSPNQKDVKVQGKLLAIGDTISSVNPLGWEGIRHAMASGREGAKAIQRYLSGKEKDLSSYEKRMKHYFGKKWLFSEMFMHHLYRSKNDKLIDHSVRSFKRMNNKEIIDVIFHYQFRNTLKSYFWYFLSLFGIAKNE